MTATGERERYVNDMGIQCVSCAGRSFRRSRLKVSDVWSLLVLRYPVRCLSCSKRQTVPLPVATQAVSSKVKQVRAMQENNLTEKSSGTQGPSIVGGNGAWTMPVHERITMPDLHGVTLKHHSSLPVSDESSSR